MQMEFVSVQHDIFALSQKGKDGKNRHQAPPKKKIILITAFCVKGLMMKSTFAMVAKINIFSTVVTNSDRKPKIRRVSGTRCLASVRGPSNLQWPHPQRPGWSGRGRRAGGARGPWPGRACR